MLKKLKTILLGVFSVIIVVAIGASAYTAFASPSNDQETVPENIVDRGLGNGYGNGNANAGTVTDHIGKGNGTGTSVLDIPASDLNPNEAVALLFMREEEKMAGDVYDTLYSIWGQPTFANIASSELMHMDEVKQLLDRYNLTDPALEPGSFTDPSLQALYDGLVAQSFVSVAEALKVGGAIEEIDILDLQVRVEAASGAVKMAHLLETVLLPHQQIPTSPNRRLTSLPPAPSMAPSTPTICST